MPTILVLDDDDGFLAMLSQILEAAGYEVLSRLRWPASHRAYQSHPADLVLADLVMPNKEGLEMIIELTGLYPAVKIIAMTGALRQEYLKVAKLLGSNEYSKSPSQNRKF